MSEVPLLSSSTQCFTACRRSDRSISEVRGTTTMHDSLVNVATAVEKEQLRPVAMPNAVRARMKIEKATILHERSERNDEKTEKHSRIRLAWQ